MDHTTTEASREGFIMASTTTEASREGFIMASNTTEANREGFSVASTTTEASGEGFSMGSITTEVNREDFSVASIIQRPTEKALVWLASLQRPTEKAISLCSITEYRLFKVTLKMDMLGIIEYRLPEVILKMDVNNIEYTITGCLSTTNMGVNNSEYIPHGLGHEMGKGIRCQNQWCNLVVVLWPLLIKPPHNLNSTSCNEITQLVSLSWHSCEQNISTFTFAPI